MRSVRRQWLTPLGVCALALCLGGAARAVDEPAGHGDKAHEQKVYDLLRDLINEGADLYNAGDYSGCYHFWAGALKTLRPALEHHADWAKAVDGALAEARGVPVMWQRAWVLRRAMDKIRDDIHPPKKAEATATAPTPGTRPPATPPGTTRSPGTTEAPKTATLWDRLGGEPGVSKVIDEIVAVAGKDAKVDFNRGGKYKFDKAELADFHKEMADWVSAHTGGPHKYTGKSMKIAHEGMHITNAQFDALAADVKGVLEKHNVKPADVEAILKAVEATRKDIVEAKPEEETKPEKKPETTKPEKKPEDRKPEEKKPEDKKPEDKKPADKEDKKEAKKTDATVEGKVTYKGKPLPNGTIGLVGKDGTVASTATDDEGSYAVKAVKPGVYRITVATAVPTATGKQKYVRIPEKYAKPETSGLTFEVIEGAQTFDIALQ